MKFGIETMNKTDVMKFLDSKDRYSHTVLHYSSEDIPIKFLKSLFGDDLVKQMQCEITTFLPIISE